MKPTSKKKHSTEIQKEFNIKSLTRQADGIDQDQTARAVKSDLDLCRPQKYLHLPMALKELIFIPDI